MTSLESRLRLVVRLTAGVLAAAVVALVVTLGIYLAKDDARLADGTSRWTSGSDDAEAQTAFWLALVLSVAATVGLVAAARSGRLRIAVGAVAVGGLAVAATSLAFVAYTDL